MDFDEHEMTIIWKAIGRDGGCCEGNAAERLDWICVQLERSRRTSHFQLCNQGDGLTCVIFISSS